MVFWKNNIKTLKGYTLLQIRENFRYNNIVEMANPL